MKKFKPMLGIDIQGMSKDKLRFPVLVSEKLDGIRCIFKDGEMVSRSLKPIANIVLHEKFEYLKRLSKDLGIILDGELYSPELNFQQIVTEVMSKAHTVSESLNFYCFDFIEQGKFDLPFDMRVKSMKKLQGTKGVVFVEQTICNSFEQIETIFEKFVEKGKEGVIVRNTEQPYKFGRSTKAEQGLMKLKPWNTYDAIVIDVEQEHKSTAESTINELGASVKSHKKADIVPIERASAFRVRLKDKELKVSLAMTIPERNQIWKNKEDYIGKWIEFKGMSVGAKNVPRHPVFVRYRHDRL